MTLFSKLTKNAYSQFSMRRFIRKFVLILFPGTIYHGKIPIHSARSVFVLTQNQKYHFFFKLCSSSFFCTCFLTIRYKNFFSSTFPRNFVYSVHKLVLVSVFLDICLGHIISYVNDNISPKKPTFSVLSDYSLLPPRSSSKLLSNTAFPLISVGSQINAPFNKRRTVDNQIRISTTF